MGFIKNVPSQSLSEVQNIIAIVGRPVHTMPFFSLSSDLRTSKEQRLDTLNVKNTIGTRRHSGSLTNASLDRNAQQGKPKVKNVNPN